MAWSSPLGHPISLAAKNDESIDFAGSGSPMDNEIRESFNGRPGDDCLNANEFLSI
jgi:hypothetical protein